MTPGASGARCALHPLELAVATCARCGNFMCQGCAAPAGGGRCPPCQQLAPAGFPLGAEADLGGIWAYAWSVWRTNLLMLSLASLVFLVAAVGASILATLVGRVVTEVATLASGGASSQALTYASLAVEQVLSTLISAGVQAVVLSGFYRMLLDVLEGRPADLGRLFSQLHQAPRMFGLQLLTILVFTLPLMAVLVGAAIYSLRGLDVSLESLRPEEVVRLLPQLMGTWAVASALLLPVLFLTLPITLFSAPELVLSECGPTEAFRRAWRLGAGQRWRMTGYSLVSAALVVAGAFACGVGILPAMPLAYLLLLALYLSIRRGAQPALD